MLQITVKGRELWDEASGVFDSFDDITLNLEHSLVSVSKWEARWHKPFFSNIKHTEAETQDYVKCMCVDCDVSDSVIQSLSNDDYHKIDSYINDPMSAIPIKNTKSSGRGGFLPSEKIYSWMISYGIPFECERWHISRLLNLINLCEETRTPPNKKSSREVASMYSKLNAERRKQYNTRG